MMRLFIAAMIFLTTPIFTGGAAVAQEHGLYPLCPRNGDLCGYVNNAGTWVIEPVFGKAEEFSDSLAEVIINGSHGFIDQTGRMVLELEGGLSVVEPFRDGVAWVKRDSRIGLLDRDGKWVVEPRFKYTWQFSEGLASVKLGSLYGFIDRRGRMVIEPRYQNALFFSDGLAVVKLNDLWGAIDQTGHMVIEPRFQELHPFGDGIAGFRLNNGRVGAIDRTGRVVIEPRFEQIWSFSDGLARALLNNKFGFIDRDGNWISEPRFEFAHDFGNGLATVQLNGRWGVINREGRWLLEPQWSRWVDIVDPTMIRVFFAGGQQSGYLNGAGRPLTFTMEDFLLAELQSVQTQSADELAEARAEIERLRQEAEDAATRARQQRNAACNHIYVGQRINQKVFLGLGLVIWEVVGVNPNTRRVTLVDIQRGEGSLGSKEEYCSSLPYQN